MQKKLTKGTSFFMTDEMFEKVRRSSEEKETSISHLLRSLVRKFLESEASTGAKSKDT